MRHRKKEPMKHPSLLPLAATAATLFTACLFSGPADHPSEASVRLEIKASAGTLAGLAKTSGLGLDAGVGVGIDLHEAWLSVDRIKIETAHADGICDTVVRPLKKEGKPGDDDSGHGESETEIECEDSEVEFAFRGPFVIDLMTGVSTPDLGGLVLPPGNYHHVKFEMRDRHDGSFPDGRTLMARGNLTLPDGSVRPFSLSLGLNENLKIRSDSGLRLDGGSVQTVAVRLLAGDWLKGLDLASCLGEGSASDTIEITEDSPIGKCLDAEHLIKENFRDSFRASKKEEERDDEDRHESDEHEQEHEELREMEGTH